MPLLPAYLVVVTVAFVVMPSVATICLRFALYKHLVFLEERVKRLINRGDRGNQPEIVKELERRFKEASCNLERVNTAALIDQVYSQEKVLFISCEQIDYFCRTLPSLLLAFGLLGTFLGITINLSALSQTISQTNISDVSSLVRELQEPLKGMGIAFTTSLTGIFFSAVLTAFNLIKNTSIAKYKLISALEDYLDNIYLPKVQGNNRLDRAVDRLVFEFKDFLGRFGTTVRNAVESSLGEKIQEIVDVNKQASQLARQVYSGFQESSCTIASSATDLKHAVSAFEDAVAAMLTNSEKFQQAAQTFENSQFPQRLSEATANLANTQSNFSQSALSLANTAQSIEFAVIGLQSSSQKLVELGEKVSTINQNSVRVIELHQSNQQSLCEIIPQLQEGGQSFQLAVKTFDKLQKRIVDRADSLDKVQVELTKLVETLNNSTTQVNFEVKSLGDRLVEGISNQAEANNYQAQIVVEKLQQYINHQTNAKQEKYIPTQIIKKQL